MNIYTHKTPAPVAVNTSFSGRDRMSMLNRMIESERRENQRMNLKTWKIVCIVHSRIEKVVKKYHLCNKEQQSKHTVKISTLEWRACELITNEICGAIPFGGYLFLFSSMPNQSPLLEPNS